MTIVEVRQLSKAFGGITALSEVSFQVRQGEFVGVIGANGAGKTTLFSVMSGFYAPSRGSVRLRGRNITGLKPFEICRRGMVRTFQVVRPFRNMTVLHNVMVGKLFGKDRFKDSSAARNQAMSVLGTVRLASKADIPAGELTLAEHKRLELARALTANPDVLLLDEVLAGLTPTETAEAMEIVRGIHRSRQLTILMVEHVMKAVVGLCERIVVLHYGRKIAEGSPEEITQDPRVIEAYLGEDLEV